jgi:XTP/dITP diphosphohydrolase
MVPNAAANFTTSTGVRLSAVLPPIVPRIPDMDFINVTCYDLMREAKITNALAFSNGWHGQIIHYHNVLNILYSSCVNDAEMNVIWNSGIHVDPQHDLILTDTNFLFSMKTNLSAPDEHRAEKLQAFDRLLTIMNDLRENCPWDKKQTLESLRHLTIEETYELSDAILEGDLMEIKKELGDILLHLVFYARIASEKKAFDITDVLTAICDKLIERHPHIYGDVVAEDEEAVKTNWEKIKLKTGNKSVLGGVPQSLPALVKAMRIQDKARGVGFDWERKEQVWEKVEEEMQEFKAEFNVVSNDSIDKEKAVSEFGDLLFSLVNYARFIKIDPEEALERTNKKFIKRFQFLETESAKEGKVMGEMSLAEMDKYWEKAKKL